MGELNENSINSLIEMGIPRDIAIDALSRANGNLEAAVNFIFSNELPAEAENSDIEIISYKEKANHVEISNKESFQPGDLTEVIANQQPLQPEFQNYVNDNSENIDSNCYVSDKIVDNMDYYSSDSDYITNSVTDNLLPPSYQIVKHSDHKSRLRDPTVILPLPPNSMIENYFALYSLCITNYLPHIIMRPDFKDLSFTEDWFKGSSFSKPKNVLKSVTDETTSKSTMKICPIEDMNQDDDQPELLWQLQKLSSIVNSTMSERAYVCAKIFSVILDQQSQIRLAEADHLNEVLPSFIKYLVVNLESCPGFEEDEIRKLFISSAFYTPSDDQAPITTLLSLFHFLPDEYDSNLYKMFNVLLYPDENDSDYESGDESEQGNSLGDISPILSIVFDEAEEGSSGISLPEGVEVPLEFFPQIYTKDCKNKLIKHIIAKRKDAQFKSKEILNDINSIKSFQGKDILKFINSSLEYLERDNKSDNITEELLKIKNDMAIVKTQKMNEYRDLAQKLQNEWNISNPETHIVETGRKLGLIGEPYLLVMAVLSPYSYYIRERTGKWNLVQCSTTGGDFDVRECSSELEVKDTIKQATRHASETPLMFMYCRRDVIPEEYEIRKSFESNSGCLNFFKEDQLVLNKMNNSDENI
ncbi:hypothetical protein Kpol_543p9 [Vanderwaltozyma polyspora DSM 70294]|uniref:UBA domain-containing protein n=1 Tax=Vanderwaltozyma polyspora (strain ATCC 22028 / DSM 70294 / BCRC 21397 / CBS 2163 / NBRC 10782 / NRRL Y-8283 / UCD 57-17) TaxID=436907 RepID=A7THL4_VANPO|nr:uncharacterized protein Kpol_543p9 [Vanderwaltozyma polyspora DSM 70294]EDO18180.1 hypothetical protein Kpol_543p9 [Vanderwaltozyma polyspora DSM 70294]